VQTPEEKVSDLKPFVSIVMPAYNEEEHITDAINNVIVTLDRMGHRYEVIVVDDGSTDGTADAVRNVADERIKLVSYGRNVGKGFALMQGLEHASGEFTVFMDSDMEVKLRNLNLYLKALKDSDLVIASKWHPKSRYEAPLLRKFLSLGFQILVRLLTGVKASDTQSGLKAGRTEALKRISHLLSVKRYAFDVELLTVAQLLDYKLVEMPIEIKLSSRFSLKEVLRMLIDLLGIAYRLRIKKWYQRNLKKGGRYRPLIRW